MRVERIGPRLPSRASRLILNGLDVILMLVQTIQRHIDLELDRLTLRHHPGQLAHQLLIAIEQLNHQSIGIEQLFLDLGLGLFALLHQQHDPHDHEQFLGHEEELVLPPLLGVVLGVEFAQGGDDVQDQGFGVLLVAGGELLDVCVFLGLALRQEGRG